MYLNICNCFEFDLSFVLSVGILLYLNYLIPVHQITHGYST